MQVYLSLFDDASPRHFLTSRPERKLDYVNCRYQPLGGDTILVRIVHKLHVRLTTVSLSREPCYKFGAVKVVNVWGQRTVTTNLTLWMATVFRKQH